MQLEDAKLGQPCHQDHDPVVIRLNLRLVDRTDSKQLQRVAKFVDKLVEERKVEELVEVLEHELEAELVIQVSPTETCSIILVNPLATHFSES